MLLKIALILLISGSCVAKIKLNITLTSTRWSTIIKYDGYDDKNTTNKEVSLFNITEDNLKRGFKKELGRTPDEVFLSDPTTNGNIFEQFKWRSAYRSIRITNIKIVDIVNKNVTVKVEKLFNKAADVSRMAYGVSEIIENMVVSTWSTNGLPQDNITYDLNIKYGLTNSSFVRNWRDKKSQHKSCPFGINSTGEIIMKPEDVVVKDLSGRVVGSYAEVYGHYRFWAPSVGDIMKAANLSNKIETTELIKIVWHTDPEIVVSNDVTKEEVLPYFTDKPYRAVGKETKLRLKKPKKVNEKKTEVPKPENKEKELDDKCVPKAGKDDKKKKYRVFPPKEKWRIVRT